MAPKRLSNAAGSSFVSKSALSTILTSARENPALLQEGLSRQNLKRKFEGEANVTTPFGPVIQELTIIRGAKTLKLSLLSLIGKDNFHGFGLTCLTFWYSGSVFLIHISSKDYH